jgi:hypothetical protein
MKRALAHLRSNAVAYAALFVALGGTSYAALNLPAGSVRTKQLHNGAVTPPKLDGKLIGGTVRAWAYISAAGHEVNGSGIHGAGIVKGVQEYTMLLNNQHVRGCAAMASVVADPRAANPFAPGSAIAAVAPPGRKGFHAAVAVETYDATGQPAAFPFMVQVLC